MVCEVNRLSLVDKDRLETVRRFCRRTVHGDPQSSASPTFFQLAAHFYLTARYEILRRNVSNKIEITYNTRNLLFVET